MAFSINTNETALSVLRTLAKATQNLTVTSQRVSTGQRVSSPADDGAVFAIGKKTASDVAAWGAVRERQVFGRLVVDAAVRGATSISDKLRDLKAEALSYAGVYDDDQKKYIKDSIISKLQDINNIVRASEFEGKNLLCVNEPYAVNAPNGNPTPSGLGVYADITKTPLGDSILYGPGIWSGGKPPQQNATNLTLDWNIQGPPLNIDVVFANSATHTQTTALSFPAVTGQSSMAVAWPGTAGGWDTVLVHATPAGPPPTPTAYNIMLSDRYPTPPPAAGGPAGGSFTVPEDIEGNVYNVEYRCMTVEGLGLIPFTFDPIDQGLKQIDDATAAAGDNMNYWGGKSRLIDNSMKFEGVLTDALTESNGAILDADMAVESAKLQAEQIKQNLAAQSLTITNNAPQLILGLFR